jgi:hypothetical protein
MKLVLGLGKMLVRFSSLLLARSSKIASKEIIAKSGKRVLKYGIKVRRESPLLEMIKKEITVVNFSL